MKEVPLSIIIFLSIVKYQNECIRICYKACYFGADVAPVAEGVADVLVSVGGLWFGGWIACMALVFVTRSTKIFLRWAFKATNSVRFDERPSGEQMEHLPPSSFCLHETRW